MRKKYGFSLVELTIVLIIVGIIIAMFMGGISFMEKARIKTELGKLSKFSSSLTTYYAQNGTMPKIWGSGIPSGAPSKSYEPANFEDFGLTADDFKSNYQVSKDENSYIVSSCWLRSTGNAPDHKYYYEDNASAPDPSHIVCVYFNKFYGRFICNLEKSIDDKRTDKNDGLRWGTTQDLGAGSNDSYAAVSCDEIADDKQGYYGYKIFQY
jgi:prepilin-type N-terminal cleavage/methylation domain-containing protein